MARRALVSGASQLVQLTCSNKGGIGGSTSLPACVQHIRVWSSVPEYYGKPSPYSSGTGFLGTPTDHLERSRKRPVSPHLFEPDGKGFHYVMPINAVSSILNRVTGTALSVAAGGAGFIALTGDLPAAMEAFKASHPLLLYPLRGAIAFPLIYHYLGGLRHVIWEHSTIGKQSDKTSYLENDFVDKSSKAIFGVSIAGTLAAMIYSS